MAMWAFFAPHMQGIPAAYAGLLFSSFTGTLSSCALSIVHYTTRVISQSVPSEDIHLVFTV